VNVLVGHFSVAGSRYSKDQYVPPFDIQVREEYLERFDVVMLGHLHEPQKYYSGTIARGGFGEESMEVGFKVHDWDSETRTAKEQFIKLPARDFVTIDVKTLLETDPESLRAMYLESVLRVKGSVKRHEYDAVSRKIRSLGIPYLKNAVEVEPELARLSGNGNGADVAEELSIAEAVRLWGKGRDGMDKVIDGSSKRQS